MVLHTQKYTPALSVSSSYFRYLGTFNLHVRLKNKQINKLSKQFAYKLAKLQDKQIQKETHNIVPNSLESLWQKAQWALSLAPISCLLEHYFSNPRVSQLALQPSVKYVFKT